MKAPKRKRAVVLISGRGSNLGALAAAAKEPGYPAEIAGVISNRADAKGLETAGRLGIATRVIADRDFSDREAHEAAIRSALRELRADIVCLAGYMRLLTPAFVADWQGRMINIHPALLPLFKGVDTHARALAAGMRIHGCSAHFVTQEVDAGPIIAQAAVAVLPDDTEQTLAARVLKAEHRLYPLALALAVEGKARMEGGQTVFHGVENEGAAALFSPSPARPSEAESDLEALARFTP